MKPPTRTEVETWEALEWLRRKLRSLQRPDARRHCRRGIRALELLLEAQRRANCHTHREGVSSPDAV